MKKKFSLLIAVMSFMMLLGACANNPGAASAEESAAEQPDGYGAAGALSDDDYTLEEMLNYALQDEYLAKYEYETIIETFGEQAPFTNIVKAEAQHIASLLPLFEAYGLTAPEDDAASYAVIPDSLLEAGEVGVQAEIDNIAMYERFLEQDIPDDVQAVFEALRDASKNHLEAFERLVEREQ